MVIMSLQYPHSLVVTLKVKLLKKPPEISKKRSQDISLLPKNMAIPYLLEKQEGSHMILRLTTEPFSKLSVPNHKELSKGLLRQLINDIGLTVEEFILLK